MSDEMSSTTEDADAELAAGAALESAQAFYWGQKLRLPPLPRALAARLTQWDQAEWGIASGEGEANRHDLTDRPGFLDRAMDPASPDDVAFGYVGHGAASWWMCFQLMSGPLAVFVRQSYGGPYREPEPARRALDGIFRDLEVLLVKADAAAEEEIIPKGQRLIVVIDDRNPSVWGLSGDPDHWIGADDPLLGVEAFLEG
jgi:hypothetical protein